MSDFKHKCGQCEFYLPIGEKCPHKERTAFHNGCEIFKYTNPLCRIDTLQAELEGFWNFAEQFLTPISESARQEWIEWSKTIDILLNK